ncbi:MAG: hypothetical protein M0R73_10580 [Dehalococcoidia bacterium]|nr:hypothetical protein [Dehalococcoidia bacterium]
MNPVAWFEINGPESQKKALQDFYANTFDWKFGQNLPNDYGMVEKADDAPGIGGAVDASDRGAEVLIFIEVDGLNAYLDRAKENGAEVVQGQTDVPGMVSYALIRDPAGNVVGVMDSATPEG